jgi:TRAP-type C4-dicarboxylate transport system permease small subunit
MVMKSKTPKAFDWISVICVAILALIFSNIGYRLWVAYNTDWGEMFQQMRPIDYMATVVLVVLYAVIRFWRDPKP